MKIHNKWKITVKESAWNLGITTKQSPTKRSLTNCSREMVHGWWLGSGFKFRVRDMVSVRVSEPLFVNHFLLNFFSVNVLLWTEICRGPKFDITRQFWFTYCIHWNKTFFGAVEKHTWNKSQNKCAKQTQADWQLLVSQTNVKAELRQTQ